MLFYLTYFAKNKMNTHKFLVPPLDQFAKIPQGSQTNLAPDITEFLPSPSWPHFRPPAPVTPNLFPFPRSASDLQAFTCAATHICKASIQPLSPSGYPDSSVNTTLTPLRLGAFFQWARHSHLSPQSSWQPRVVGQASEDFELKHI